jgi:predicted RNase H-like HicB family nuclease
VAISLSFTAVFEPVEDGWIEGRILEFPAVITAASSMEEARELLTDALAEYLAALAPDDGPLPDHGTSEPLPVTVGT